MIAARPSLAELDRRCQKIDHRRLGNWMARRISRPLALRVTWVILPWGISAHAMTLAAWACGLAAAAALWRGSLWSWLAAAALLQLWYLLDHVDGQLARYNGTASLDGVQLDYLMHHSLNLLVPLCAGAGVMNARGHQAWLLAGLVWGASSLLLGLLHDTRFKAFHQRLKLVRGDLIVTSGAAGRPQLPAMPPKSPLALMKWLLRKSCEPHVTMNLLACVALAHLFLRDVSLTFAAAYVGVMAPASLLLLLASLRRSLRNETAEREFAAQYRPPAGCSLVFEDGWWRVASDVDP